MDFLVIIIDISYFNNKGIKGKLLGITPKATDFIKGKVGGTIVNKTQYLPIVGKKIKSALGNNASYDNEKITFCVNGSSLDILYKNLYVKRVGNAMRIVVEVDKLELDSFIDSIADSVFKDNKTMCDILKAANETSEGESKYELVQLILGWINKNDMLNEVIKKLADKNKKIADIVKPMELRLGDISIEY